MDDRGFGLEVETGDYGDTEVLPENFDLDWFQRMESVDFKLNDEPVTKSGGSRMNRRARPGIMKPTGSTSADADLQRLIWYMYGFLGNYKFTEGNNGVNIHEFWGGENKELPSFRGVALYDMWVIYLYGLLEDSLKLEVADEAMSVNADWVYKTEESYILDEDEEFATPEELINDLYIMGYDVKILLDGNDPDGVQTSFNMEGNNNHNTDGTVGLNSRSPQRKAHALKRDLNMSLATVLTRSNVRSIMNGRYGKVNAVKPSQCSLVETSLKVEVRLCEYPDLGMDIFFPSATINNEFDMSGADDIETTINLASLGSKKATMVDGTQIMTDMYVKIMNNQDELGVGSSSPIGGGVPETVNISISVQDEDENPVSGAAVSIYEISSTTGNAGGCTLQNVPIGLETITVLKEGYEEYIGTIEVSEEDTSFTITLIEEE